MEPSSALQYLLMKELDLFDKSTPMLRGGAACPSPEENMETTVNLFVRDNVDHVMLEGAMLT